MINEEADAASPLAISSSNSSSSKYVFIHPEYMDPFLAV
jgi:hypothetical protein